MKRIISALLLLKVISIKIDWDSGNPNEVGAGDMLKGTEGRTLCTASEFVKGKFVAKQILRPYVSYHLV